MGGSLPGDSTEGCAGVSQCHLMCPSGGDADIAFAVEQNDDKSFRVHFAIAAGARDLAELRAAFSAECEIVGT
jgi:hypothetical protein